MSERSEEREITALESALRELRPQPDTLDRAVLMYRAGRASACGWVWPLATLIATTVALALGIALGLRPAPPPASLAISPVDNATLSTATPAPLLADAPERGAWFRYVHLQEQVLLHALDGLPSPPSATDEPPPDMKSLLNAW